MPALELIPSSFCGVEPDGSAEDDANCFVKMFRSLIYRLFQLILICFAIGRGCKKIYSRLHLSIGIIRSNRDCRLARVDWCYFVVLRSGMGHIIYYFSLFCNYFAILLIYIRFLINNAYLCDRSVSP